MHNLTGSEVGGGVKWGVLCGVTSRCQCGVFTETVLLVPVQSGSGWAGALVTPQCVYTAMFTSTVVYAALVKICKQKPTDSSRTDHPPNVPSIHPSN